MKILLSAYACHPNMGSEPGIGWNWVKQLSKENEVWAFIYAGQEQKEAVERAVACLPYHQNIHIVGVTVPSFFQTRFYLARYEIWHWKVYKMAKRLLTQVQIDFIHHVTIANFWNCGHLWKLDVPFIIGPISGAQKTPRAGYGFLRLRDQINELRREFLFNIAWATWKRPIRALEKARLVLASNLESAEQFKKIKGESSVVLFSDSGVNSGAEKERTPDVPKSEDCLRLLWVGELRPRKNFGLLFEALKVLPREVHWSLRIAGEDILYSYWRRKVQRSELEEHITFLGSVDHSDIDQEYRWAHVFVFPSLREATGTVILEAMSYKLPVIALNLHGARFMLDDDCAIRIPVVTRHQMINDLRDAITKLYRHSELRAKMGELGRRRIEQDFLWEKRGERMNRMYRQVLGSSEC
jgi:glycosyltransferase involved in cell wall biosynthesis